MKNHRKLSFSQKIKSSCFKLGDHKRVKWKDMKERKKKEINNRGT